LINKKQFKRNYFQKSLNNTPYLDITTLTTEENSLSVKTNYKKSIGQLFLCTSVLVLICTSLFENSQTLLVDVDSRRSVLVEIFNLVFNNTVVTSTPYNSSEMLVTVLPELVLYFNILM